MLFSFFFFALISLQFHRQALSQMAVVDEPIQHWTTTYAPPRREASFQLKDPKVEFFRGVFKDPFSKGRIIRVIGKRTTGKHFCNEYKLSLYHFVGPEGEHPGPCCSPEDDVLLHIKINYQAWTIGFNTHHFEWDEEEIVEMKPDGHAQKLAVTIRAGPDAFQIRINHYSQNSGNFETKKEFPYRIYHHNRTSLDVTHLIVQGSSSLDNDGCVFEGVQFYGEVYNRRGLDEPLPKEANPKLLKPTTVWQDLPTPLVPGKSVLLIQGVVIPLTANGGEHQFTVSLHNAYGDFVLYWNVRLDTEIYLLNAKVQDSWGAWERANFVYFGGPLFQNHRTFELYVFYLGDRFELKFCGGDCHYMAQLSFKRRSMDYEELDSVYVYGDVWVTNVQVLPSREALKAICLVKP